MHKLGGSLFIHNGLKYDFCLKESIESLIELCDEVVVLDAESDDGTLDFLQTLEKSNPKLKVYDHGKWECAEHYDRLPILANQAKELLNSEWHFMLQADEVIHEDSFPYIHRAISFSEKNDIVSVYCHRVNMFKTFNHYISFDSPSKPCGDKLIRLAKTEMNAFGDAESLERGAKFDSSFLPYILIFHYGFIRKPKEGLCKAIDMQSWFGYGVDKRLLKMQEEDGIYKPNEFLGEMKLDEIVWEHPKIAQKWVNERRHFYEEEATIEPS